MENPHESEESRNNIDSEDDYDEDSEEDSDGIDSEDDNHIIYYEDDDDVDGEEDDDEVGSEYVHPRTYYEDDDEVDSDESDDEIAYVKDEEDSEDDDEVDSEEGDQKKSIESNFEVNEMKKWSKIMSSMFLNNIYTNTVQILETIQSRKEFQIAFSAYVRKYEKLSIDFSKNIFRKFKKKKKVDQILTKSTDIINKILTPIIEIQDILNEMPACDQDSDEDTVYNSWIDKLYYKLEDGIMKEIAKTAKSANVKLRPPSLEIAKISNIAKQGLPEPQQKLETTLVDVARVAKIELDRLKKIDSKTEKLMHEVMQSTNNIFTIMNKFKKTGGSCKIMNELRKALNKLKNDMNMGVSPEKQVLQTNLPHISMLTERFVVVANARPSSTCPYSLKDGGVEAYSPSQAWDRARHKMRPSTMAALSPIVPFDAILKPVCDMGSVFDHDTQFSGLIWILSMSEQSYYDNTLLTISYKLHRRGPEEMEQLRMLLRHNFVVRDKKFLADHWVNVVKMGAGSFGDVVKVTEKDTGRSLAVKILRKEENESTFFQMNFVVTYLMERNHLVRARDSPFVVQFHESLVMSDPAVLFLVFDICVGDLNGILNPLTKSRSDKSFTLEKLWHNRKNFIPTILKILSQEYQFDVSEMMLVYVFEMLCALDYLAKCNIIHKDLIPSNIMISQNFHVKVADFGIANNLFYIHADSKLEMLGSDELHKVDDMNAQVRHDGTYNYMDLEFRARNIMMLSLNSVDFIFTSPNLIVKELLPAEPNFLLDLWAVGKCVDVLIPLLDLVGQ